jgi:hypothetical protein
MKYFYKKKQSFLLIILLFSFCLNGCATHSKQILISGLVGGVVGAGVGYSVIHHGAHRQYVVPNTIIASSLVALGTMGVMAWHYSTLDQQKIDITSNMSRSWLMRNPQGAKDLLQESGTDFIPRPEEVGQLSLKLDEETRWIYPTFRKRNLKPESSNQELLSSRYVWEILKPGFFVTRETNPYYFTDEATSPSSKKNLEEIKP